MQSSAARPLLESMCCPSPETHSGLVWSGLHGSGRGRDGHGDGRDEMGARWADGHTSRGGGAGGQAGRREGKGSPFLWAQARVWSRLSTRPVQLRAFVLGAFWFRCGIPTRAIRTMETLELVVTASTGLVSAWNASPWPSKVLLVTPSVLFSAELEAPFGHEASEMTGFIPRPGEERGRTRAGCVLVDASALPFPSPEQEGRVHVPVRRYTLARS